MNHFLHGTEIARATAPNSRSRMIIVDHPKIGVTSRVTFCPTEEIDILKLDPAARKGPGLAALEENVCRLVIAG